jgi:hypothetical protein
VAKVSRPIIYAALFGVVAYAAVVLTEPETPTKKTTKKTTATAKKNANDPYLPQDYKAKFERVNLPVKNAFKPLVVRQSAGGALDSLRLDGLPAGFAGGDPNWRYTGTAEIDGVRVALIENHVSGDGVFLKVGETWNQTVLTSIETEAIVMVGPGGAVRRIRLGEPEESRVASGNTVPNQGMAAVPPVRVGGISGPISAGPLDGGMNLESAPRNRGRNRNNRGSGNSSEFPRTEGGIARE